MKKLCVILTIFLVLASSTIAIFGIGDKKITANNYIVAGPYCRVDGSNCNLTGNVTTYETNHSYNYVYDGSSWLGMKSDADGILQIDISSLESSADLDSYCAVDDRILRRELGSWACYDDSAYYDDTTCDSSTCSVTNTGTLDGYEGSDLDDWDECSDVDGCGYLTAESDPIYVAEKGYYQNFSSNECPAGYYAYSRLQNGTWICREDTGGSGDGNFMPSYANYLGSDLTGSSGDTNRQLTADVELIQVDNYFLHPDVDYSEAGGTITFLNPIWDDQRITLWVNSTLSSSNYLGSDLTGSSGDANRILAHSQAEMVVVDNSFLHPVDDYTDNSTHVTFLNPIWNEQRITLWS